MRTIFIIGTMHTMMPEHAQELELLFTVMNPDVLFIEVLPEDVKKENFKDYPSEMTYAYVLARKFEKKVFGFDTDVDVVNLTLPTDERKKIDEEMAHIVAAANWKEFNKIDSELYKKLSVLTEKCIDVDKDRQRHMGMLGNIEKNMPAHGKVLILTGSFHLPFFREHIKGALFPLER